jgi:hypothetical protein
MSREQLLGLAGEVERLLGAGAVAAAGHPGLARRAAALRELARGVPALAAVAAAVERLTAAPGKQAAPALLDLALLTRQLRASLAAAGAGGPATAPPPSGPWRTPAAARDLYPAYEALTGSGSDRHEALKDLVERNGAGDLRLVPALLGVLKSSNFELADLAAEQALPALGRAVLPDLTAQLNLKGKIADARRLKAVCKIDPELGAGLCRRALAEGSLPVRIGALGCLPKVGKPGEAEQAGLALCHDKQIGLRLAGLYALSGATTDEGLEALVEALAEEDWGLCWTVKDLVEKVPHPKATARLAREIERRVAALPPSRAKKGGKGRGGVSQEERERQLGQIELYVETMAARKDDPQTALAALLPLTRHDEPDLRAAALKALGTVGVLTPEVRAAFGAALATPKGEGAAATVEGLALMPPEQREPLVPRLLELLADPKLEEEVAHPAVALLPAHTGRYGKAILERLRVQLRRKEWWPRDAVLDAVKALGVAAAPLVPDLLEALPWSGEAEDWEEVFAVADPEGTAVPALVEALAHRKAAVRAAALDALAGYKEKARAAEAAVEKLRKDRADSVRFRIKATLEAIRGES